jgi:hypothetical protein
MGLLLIIAGLFILSEILNEILPDPRRHDEPPPPEPDNVVPFRRRRDGR